MILAARASFVLTGYFTDRSDKLKTLATDLLSGATAFVDMRGDANAQEKREMAKRRIEMIDSFILNKAKYKDC